MFRIAFLEYIFRILGELSLHLAVFVAAAVVVTGDSVSMIAEALATAAPVFIAEVPAGRRQGLLWQSLYAAGQARPLGAGLFSRATLNETGRVAAEIRARGLLGRG